MRLRILHNKNKSQSRVILRGKPQKKQKEFFLAKQKYIAYGGARGGGKSWALRRKLVLLCLNYPGINVLLIRKTYSELRDNHIRVLMGELCNIATYTDSKKTFEFFNGSVMRMGYMDTENDVSQYQGQEYDIIALDEATQFSEYQFQILKASLRGANDFPKRIYLTCNPGGVGHSWVKRLFVDREYKQTENANDYLFIPALVYDNEILLKSNPDYLEQLKSLPEGLKSAWLDGNWEQFQGQFFPEFDFSLHTFAQAIPDEPCTKVCAIDYGLDMLAALFIAIYPSSKALVYDEIHESDLIVSKAAEKILSKSQGVVQYIAPSDLWSRQKDSGKSIAELFAENGVYLTKLSSDRTDGWLALKEWLKPFENEDGVIDSRLKIGQNCTNLIRCIPLLMHDRQKPGDVSTKPHSITHAPDALRYFAVSRQCPPPRNEQQKPLKLTQKLKIKRKV